ncbi:MAG TPA: PfkB family carbohydrate kinase [Actinomycetota bacterium]
MLDVLCIGDVMLDVHASSGALAQGGDVHGRVLVRPGGTSSNASVWAAWAGAAAGVVGAIGIDLVGDLLAGSLEARGVDVSGVVRRDGPTGVMLVVTESGERSMVADRGANAALESEDLPSPLEARGVLVSGYLLLQEPGHEVALAALALAGADLLAVEAASWPLVESFGIPRFFAETAHATVVFANEDEARVLTGEDGADAARALGERYRVAAVKRGRDGAALCVDGALHEAPGDEVVALDPTGAGDAFDGVLLARLALGDEPPLALAAACRAGGLVAASLENWPQEGWSP